MEKRGSWGVALFIVVVAALFAIAALVPARLEAPQLAAVSSCIPVFVGKRGGPEGYRCKARLKSGDTVDVFSKELVEGAAKVQATNVLSRSRRYTVVENAGGS